MVITKKKDTSCTGEAMAFNAGLSMDDMNADILKVVHDNQKAADITDAKILASNGHGVGGPEEDKPLGNWPTCWAVRFPLSLF